MKKLMVIFLVIALCATAMAGCSEAADEQTAAEETTGETEEAVTEGTDADAEDNSLQYILDKGTFIMGFDDAFPPFTYMEDDGTYTGFDVDLAKALCEKLGVELVLQPVSWAAKEQELNTYNVDVIWSGLGIVGERAEVMDMSIPYIVSYGACLVRQDSNIETLDQLAGKTVCFQTGGAYYTLFEENAPDILESFGEVIYLDTCAEMLMSLSTGAVDAVLSDSLTASYYATLEGFVFNFIYDDTIMPGIQYCVGMRKGDTALYNKVNELLIEIGQEGIAAEVSEYWFGSDLTTINESY